MHQTCIILAGGLGTRLSPALKGIPKCLAPIGNRSFLEIQMRWLADSGIDHFILSLGHAADAVIAEIDELRLNFSVDYFVEPSALGTGGAVLYCLAHAGLDEAIVINGDSIFEGNLSFMREPLRHDEQELARIATVAVDDRTRFGGILCTDGRVSEFLEKGSHGPGVINGGMYRLSRKTFGDRAIKTAFSIETDVFPDLIRENCITGIQIGTNFTDIGVPEDYYRFAERYVDGR